MFKLGLRRVWELAGHGLVLTAGKTAVMQVDIAVAVSFVNEVQPVSGSSTTRILLVRLIWILVLGRDASARGTDKRLSARIPSKPGVRGTGRPSISSPLRNCYFGHASAGLEIRLQEP